MIHETLNSPSPARLLQRRCADRSVAGPSRECAECRATREWEQRRTHWSVKPKAIESPALLGSVRFAHDFTHVPGADSRLTINEPGDAFEQEADRLAKAVMSGRRLAAGAASSGLQLQRDDTQTGPPTTKPQSEEDKYKEAAKKTAQAFLRTEAGQQLKTKAEELGKDFLSSVEGKIIAGTALGGGLAALIAANQELPVPIPEIPLDFIAPGLKAELTWKGPVRSPTVVSLKLTTGSGVSVAASYSRTQGAPGKPAEEKGGLTLTIPLGGSPAKTKSKETATAKYRAETARIAAEQEKFRQGLKTPDQRATEDKEFWDAFWRMQQDKSKKKDDLLLMRQAAGRARSPASAPPSVHEVLSNCGQPLDAATRAFLEPRFGYDFSRVRVHTDERAADSARAVRANAYTVGSDIVFAAGQFAPQTYAGRKLLAHELAHAVQQGAARKLAGERSFEMLASPRRARTSLLQRYTVPGNLACNEVVDWMNSNSPYAPEWAATQCTYSFNGRVHVTPSTLPDGTVQADVRGNNRLSVSVSCPIDRPQWNPSRRPNRAAEVAAWRAMRATLDAHEAEHRRIGRTWRSTLEGRWRGVHFTVTGTDRADAMANATAELQSRQQQWMADAQAAQDAIDPFRGAVLNCS